MTRRCLDAGEGDSIVGRSYSSFNRTKRGFTLVELLTVIAILAALAALLFPVLSRARASARSASCLSNLRQIGLAMRMYCTDHDGSFPFAIDPGDRYTDNAWGTVPEFQALVSFLPMFQDVLQPYIRSRELFHCPADTGYVEREFGSDAMFALPTSFARYGTSYDYRTELAVYRVSEDNLPHPSSTPISWDAAGRWHGGEPDVEWRYNLVYADGHAKNLGVNAWIEALNPPLGR